MTKLTDDDQIEVRPAEFQPLTVKNPEQNEKKSFIPINFLSDIPVRITVELGKTRKSVKEVLELKIGNVIRLDRQAGEPVDMLVNGKIFAHGEVVVIDENFGVRIVDIVNSATGGVIKSSSKSA